MALCHRNYGSDFVGQAAPPHRNIHSFDLICKALSGDETSIKEILNFYDAYISKLCLHPFYHENGNVSMQVDEE